MPENTWISFSKDIADNDYYLGRSCIRQNFFPAAENLFIKIVRDVLGKNIYDDPEQTSCTGIAYHSGIVPLETTMTVVARHFALMTEAGYKNFVCSCVTSFGIYAEMIETWKHFPHTLEQTRKTLKETTGREFEIPDNIVHTSDVIYKYRKELTPFFKYRLIDAEMGNPIPVVDHVGCHYAKIFPEYGEGGAEYPRVLSALIEEWGGATVDYPERRHCCGFGFRQYLIKSTRGYSISNSKRKFESMKSYQPDLIIANCPGCTFFLDRWQYVIAEMENTTYGENGFGIPVLTYEELAGLLLGYNPWEIGLQLHQVSVEPFLNKCGIPFDSSAKYNGMNSKKLRPPEKPECLKVF